MTRLWPDGSAITVAFDRQGHPTSFDWHGRRHTITTIHQTWSINADWWSTEGEVAREYFAVTTNDNLLCVLYYDSRQQAYYLARTYD